MRSVILLTPIWVLGSSSLRSHVLVDQNCKKFDLASPLYAFHFFISIHYVFNRQELLEKEIRKKSAELARIWNDPQNEYRKGSQTSHSGGSSSLFRCRFWSRAGLPRHPDFGFHHPVVHDASKSRQNGLGDSSIFSAGVQTCLWGNKTNALLCSHHVINIPNVGGFKIGCG